jgi:signal transduction histidine kinase
MKKTESTKEAFFKVDSRLLFQLGEQLVTNRSIALAELVKNAYDADASEVIISLKNVKDRIGGTITIKDDGVGITPEKFENAWMRIATIDAEENPYSPIYHRKKAGEKGIGRIACRKLAKVVSIISVSRAESGKKIKLSTRFRWESFLPGSELNKVPIDYQVEDVPDNEPLGTELKLIDTSEIWTDQNVKRLNFELIELFSPRLFKKEFSGLYSNKEDPGFSYKLIAPEFNINEETINKSFFKSSWAKLSGSVDKKGNATYSLAVQKPLINKTVRDFSKERKFKFLRNSTMEVYLFKYAPYFFTNSDWKWQQAAMIGRERGGVKIYADSFRVFGYGGEKDDWLGIDVDKNRRMTTFSGDIGKIPSEDNRPALHLFDYRGLVGYVQFEKNENTRLSISINRESLGDSEALSELINFVRTGINYATVVYSDERLKKEIRDKAIKEAQEEVERKKLEEEKKKAEEEQKKAEEEERKAIEERKAAEEKARKKSEEHVEAEEIRSQIEFELEKLLDKISVFEDQGETYDINRIKEIENLQLKIKKIYSDLAVARKNEKKLKMEANLESTKAIQSSLVEIQAKIKTFEQYKNAEETTIKVEKESVARQKEKYNEELSILRVLASTGTLIFIFTHEIKSFIGDVTDLNNHFNSAIEKIERKERETYTSSLAHYKNKIKMVEELGEFIGLTGGTQSRSGLQTFYVKEVVDSVCKPFAYETQKRDIEIINAVPEWVHTPVMYRSEIASILINLFTNAVKAVTNCEDRVIKFEGGETENDIIYIRCVDTGRGLDRELWEKAFDPFVSYNEPDLNFGAGTGLGLKIVRDIALGYDGSAKFIEAPSGWNTCIEIRMPLVD